MEAEDVKAAAGNQFRSLSLLLEEHGDEIKITEEVVKAAAGNEPSGTEVMDLVRTRAMELRFHDATI